MYKSSYANKNTRPSAKNENSNITVGDDVWIGYGALILGGVTIGNGSVIGAGSIVAKDIPPYSVFAGGRIIKKRFDDRKVDRLLKIDWEKIDHTPGDAYAEFAVSKISDDNFDTIFECFTENNSMNR